MRPRRPICCPMPKHETNETVQLVARWTLPPAATLGSSVRARGILLELRASLPSELRKSLDLGGYELTLSLPAGLERQFDESLSLIAAKLDGIENLPVIPREIEDILSISTAERHRWLKDGRLPSAGTRTVKLRGRARKITFHVFEPRMVEELLDQGLVDEWREEDAVAAAENRRRAAYKAKLTRSLRNGKNSKPSSGRQDEAAAQLPGWDEFVRDGFLQ